MDMTITEQQLDKFVRCLQNEEKSIATIRNTPGTPGGSPPIWATAP